MVMSLYFFLQIPSAQIFLIGAIAKAVATTATYPLQTVQAILRVNTVIGDILDADGQHTVNLGQNLIPISAVHQLSH